MYGKRTVGFFSLASHARRACEARALRARKTLTPFFTDFFTDSEKKTDCFAVYENGSTRVFYKHEVYLQITRYEMTQSSCKRDTKSNSHPGMKLAPVQCLLM